MPVETQTPSADDGRELYYDTRSICPRCHELVPGQVVERGGQILVTRTCPQHGDFDGLVCSDVAWWEQLPRFTVQGIRPRAPVASDRGCPEDCGLCPRHLQIAGTAAVEISNRCNNECPTCLADNRATFELGPAEVVAALERVLQNQDRVDVFTLSGGEPTIHPRLFEIIRALRRPEVGRIAINSNGLRIAEDDAFLDELAAERDRIYICLHYDGEGAAALRGVDPAVQRRALERLCQREIDVVPLVLAAEGVNDGELGPMVAELLARGPSVKSVMLSMMTYAGSRGEGFTGHPLTRLTIPAALDRMEQTSGGVLHRRDFMPLTMPNPMCATIGYFMVMDGTITPLIPLGDLDRIIAYTANGSFGGVNDEFEGFLRETIDRIYADPDGYQDGPGLLARFRRLLEALFPADGPLDEDARRRAAERHIKTVYLMQFMDPWTFDARRLTRCSCQHVLPDGKIVASCGYYAYHRRFDQRFA